MARTPVSADLRRIFEVLLTIHQRGPSEIEALAKEFGFADSDRLESLLRGFGDLELAPIDPVSWEVFLGDDDTGELDVTPGTVRVEAAHPLFATPPRLTVSHALMILAGLQAVADIHDPELTAAARAVGRKLRGQVVRSATPAARAMLDALHIPAEDDDPGPDHAATLRQAAGRRRVRLAVWADDVAGNGHLADVVTVDVDPVSVVADNGRVYLHARAVGTHDYGAIPLHQVVHVEVLEEPVALPRRVPPFDRRKPMPALAPLSKPVTVQLRLGPEAAWVPEYYDCTVLECHDDGSITLELTAPSRQWLVRFLRRLGAAATQITRSADGQPS